MFGSALFRVGGLNNALQQAITLWESSESATRVEYGGQPPANDGISTGGRTYLIDNSTSRIYVNGYIRRLSLSIKTVGGAGWKLKVFRDNGASFDFIGESESFTPAAIDGFSQTINLSTPVPCLDGDYIGLYVPASGEIYHTDLVAATARYVASDVTTTNAFATDDGAYAVNVKVLGTAPFMVGAGDSIMAGHNTATIYHPVTEAGPSGNLEAQILWSLRELKPALTYENRGVGGQDWSFMADSANLTPIVDIGPKCVWYICGANDAVIARTWSAIESNLNTIRGALDSHTIMIVSEIMPFNTTAGGSDAVSATVRSYNTNYAAWVAAHPANTALITCHDAMGQLRVSTGELDDLKTEYSQDGIHLSEAGLAALAALVAPQLEAIDWNPTPVLTTTTVSPSTANIDIAETQAFTASGFDQFGDSISTGTVTWSSDDTDIATINSSTGVATGVAAGTATISATAGSVVGTASLDVAAPVWSPDDETGGFLWLEADDLVALANGDPVSTWSDLFGTGNDMTGSGTARPTKVTGAINGLPAVLFDNVDDVLSSVNSLSLPFTAMVVYAPKSTSGNHRVLAGNPGSGTNNWLMGPYGGARKVYNGAFLNGDAAVIDEWHIDCVIQSTGDAKYYIDNTLKASNASNNAPGVVAMGAEPFNLEKADSLVYGVLIYTKAADATLRGKMFNYFGEKLGITVA